MRERTLSLTGEDAERLADLLAVSEARYSIAGEAEKESWCHAMLAKLSEAE